MMLADIKSALDKPNLKKGETLPVTVNISAWIASGETIEGLTHLDRFTQLAKWAQQRGYATAHSPEKGTLTITRHG